MKYIALLLLAVAPLAHAQVQTCLDVPPVAAGAGFSACKSYGPLIPKTTDLVRANSATNPNGQSWEVWGTLASTRLVCQYQTGGGCKWVAKSTIVQTPPVVTPPVTPKAANYTITPSDPTLVVMYTGLDSSIQQCFTIASGTHTATVCLPPNP